MSSAGEPRRVLRGVADGSLLVQYPEATDEEANAAAVRLAGALDAAHPDGLLDLVPGARTLFVSYDPARCGADELARRIAAAPLGEASTGSPREHRVPVAYGGAAGPDLEDVARRAGLTAEEAARRHAAAIYRVAFLGFAPGFAYLTGLPAELGAPRRATPRPRVPSRTVALAGSYSGVYPDDGPGGWNLIGKAGIELFDPRREPPVLLSPGDLVRFVSSTEDEIRPLSPPHPDPLPPGEGVFRVVSAGLWSGICGGPRSGNARWGAPPGGAMDLESLADGNEALGNSSDAPALEVALLGPELEVLADCTVLVSGSPTDAMRGGAPWRAGEPARLSRGDRVRVGHVSGGARAYLCVAGGFSTPERLGPPRRVVAGDVLFGHPAAGRDPSRLAAVRKNPIPLLVRIVLGPQEDRFEEAGIVTLLQSEYIVSSTSDRRGVRLEGPRLAYRAGASPEVAPEGTALGAIQVPGDGQPIVLGPDRPLTGGYAKVATVIRADFPRIAQAHPGSTIRFQAVSIDEAIAGRRMSLP